MPVIDKAKSLFVLLPNINIWNAGASGGTQAFLALASQAFAQAHNPAAPALPIAILDQVAPNDAVLVSLDDDQLIALKRDQPGLRIVPVTELLPQSLSAEQLLPLAPSGLAEAGPRLAFRIALTIAPGSHPPSGLRVVAYTDRAARVGIAGYTDEDGIAILMVPSDVTRFEIVQAIAPPGYWSPVARHVVVTNAAYTLACPPIDLAAADVRDHFLLRGATGEGRGVKVGVIDSGVADHPDLQLTLGRNVVPGEQADDLTDELGHGTHVCGMIAGRGLPGVGARGVAPGVTLHVYKVFGKNQLRTDSFNITKAIRSAVDDGCDLINLSVGGEGDMPDVLREVQRARAMGVVCLAASGNNYRQAVRYPARYPQVMAVGACGRAGTYPPNVAEELGQVPPSGTDSSDYVAEFSNIGSELVLIGPGVGIVSTYPAGYAVMDGTSMACPAATGALARLLGNAPSILQMYRDQSRSDAIVKLALNNANSLGFPAMMQGAGILV